MKLEIGMFIRTPYGIDKIKDIILNGNLYEDSGLYLEKGIKLVCGKEEMKKLKASHNIIDLIEVGDIVTLINGMRKEELMLIKNLDKEIHILNTHKIVSIVTKEQFEAMQYKVISNE